MNKGDQEGIARDPKRSLSIATEFDMRENYTVGGNNFDCREGDFSPAPKTGAAARAAYYCRSIYNTGSSAVTIVYQLMNVDGNKTAYINAGSYFHAYANIRLIVTSGSTASASIDLCYIDRTHGDDTGPRESA